MDQTIQEAKQPLFTRKNAIAVISVIFALFQLYVLALGALDPQRLRASHLLFAIVLVYLMKPSQKAGRLGSVIDGTLMLCAVIPLGYLILWNKTILMRMFYVQKLEWYQYLFLVMVIISLLEATRRTVGMALPIIALIALSYAYGPANHACLCCCGCINGPHPASDRCRTCRGSSFCLLFCQYRQYYPTCSISFLYSGGHCGIGTSQDWLYRL